MPPPAAAYAPYQHLRQPGRDPERLLAQARAHWQCHAGAHPDLWVFGYASLIWRPDFDFTERHATRIHTKDSKVEVLVVPTNEEWMIGHHAVNLLGLG